VAKRKAADGPRTTAPIPDHARKIAAELQQIPGVVCVVWGSRRKSNRWRHDHKCLSAHVERKLAPAKLRKAQLLPKKIDGIWIDVLEVGTPKLHVLSADGRLDSGGSLSTPTLFARRGADALALVSGHATAEADEVDVSTPEGSFSGQVELRKFAAGASVDFALVKFVGAAAATNTRHPAAEKSTAITLASRLESGDRLRHFSGKRGRSFTGIYQGVVAGNVRIDGHLYTELLSIAPATSAPFSVAGDSGSLVVDEKGRAVGGVVGEASASVFYAYEVARLASLLPQSTFGLFFKES
jgi:hypothetical protein